MKGVKAHHLKFLQCQVRTRVVTIDMEKRVPDVVQVVLDRPDEVGLPEWKDFCDKVLTRFEEKLIKESQEGWLMLPPEVEVDSECPCDDREECFLEEGDG